MNSILSFICMTTYNDMKKNAYLLRDKMVILVLGEQKINDTGAKLYYLTENTDSEELQGEIISWDSSVKLKAVPIPFADSNKLKSDVLGLEYLLKTISTKV